MSTSLEAHTQIVIFIDEQQFKVENRPHTPKELLTLAGEDPNETTLVLKHGHELDKLTDIDRPMDLKPGSHFIVYHNGPTPVS